MPNDKWYTVADTLVAAFTELQEAKTIDSLEKAAQETLALLDELNLGFLALVKTDIRGNISKIRTARKRQANSERAAKRKEGSAQSRSGSIVHAAPSPAASSPAPRPPRAVSELGESTCCTADSTTSVVGVRGTGGTKSAGGKKDGGGMDSVDSVDSIDSVESVRNAKNARSTRATASGKDSALSPAGDEPLLISESVSASKEVAVGCIWLAHTFAFISALLKNITDPELEARSPSELAKMAYLATLRPHHNRATAAMFELAFKTLQARKKFVEKLGIDEKDAKLRARIQEYSARVRAFVEDTYQYYDANAIKV